MKKNSNFVDNILKKLQNDYIKIEEERSKYKETLKSKKVQKKVIDRHVYIQNIEKKLNEIVAHSMEIKKQDKKPNFSLSHKQLPSNEDPNLIDNFKKMGEKSLSRIEKLKISLALEEKNSMKRKDRLCRLFFSTGVCRWGDKCNFAHSVKDIEGEYRPKVWVSNFKASEFAFKIRPQTQGSSKQNSTPFSQSFSKEEFQAFSIDKIINKKGRTLLLEAVIQSDFEGVKKLVMNGASVAKQDWANCDSLMYAIKRNDWEILNLCLDFCIHSIDLNKKFFSTKSTYLIIAAQNAQAKIIKCLLYHKSDPNVCDLFGRSALFYCAIRNDFESVQCLINEGADINLLDNYDLTCLDLAFQKKRIEIVEYLFMKGGSMFDNTKHKNLLFLACEYDRRELINEAIKRGVSTNECNSNGQNILMICYENGNDSLCRQLIEEFSLIHLITQKNKRGENLFIMSIKDSNNMLSSYLIEKVDIDLNFRDKNGKNALMYSSEIGNYNIVDLLVKKNADPNLIDKQGQTPLMYASKNNHILCVENLLKGSQVNAKWKDNLEKNARNYACSEEVKKMINFYMMENNQMSDSLIKEFDQETFQYNLEIMKKRKESINKIVKQQTSLIPKNFLKLNS